MAEPISIHLSFSLPTGLRAVARAAVHRLWRSLFAEIPSLESASVPAGALTQSEGAQ